MRAPGIISERQMERQLVSIFSNNNLADLVNKSTKSLRCTDLRRACRRRRVVCAASHPGAGPAQFCTRCSAGWRPVCKQKQKLSGARLPTSDGKRCRTELQQRCQAAARTRLGAGFVKKEHGNPFTLNIWSNWSTD